MSVYYCHLGNTPELSLYELQVLLPSADAQKILPSLAKITLESDTKAQELMSVVGGTVKIYKHLETMSEPSEEAVISSIVEHLRTDDFQKVTFGISTVGNTSFTIDTADVKNGLKAFNISSRYVDSMPPYGVAAAVLLKKNTREIVVVNVGKETILTETIAIQDINDWTKRDRHKPYADRKKGMLPPKVARMMVNIGLGLLPLDKDLSSVTLYDPFCGSGTTLIEAMNRGCNVFGSDLDKEAVIGIEKNLEWAKAEYGLFTDYSVELRDATQHFSPQENKQFDLIVTEPFLGKPTPKEQELPNMLKGLHRLYLGALKNWTHILQDGAPVIIVFPYVEVGKRVFSLESLIDKLTNLGYTSVSNPIMYSRPQAIIQRQIQFLRYNKR